MQHIGTSVEKHKKKCKCLQTYWQQKGINSTEIITKIIYSICFVYFTIVFYYCFFLFNIVP